MKLNYLLQKKNVITSGFPAFTGLSEFSTGEGDVYLSTLPAASLTTQGIVKYYAPILPRDVVFNTTQDIIDADIDVFYYEIEKIDIKEAIKFPTIVVTRHKGTEEHLLKKLSKGVPILRDKVTARDITGRHVIGTLPPHLISACAAYSAVNIKDFDYASGDNDLTGAVLEKRIVVHRPIRLIRQQ